MITHPVVHRHPGFLRKLCLLPWLVCSLALLTFQDSILASRIANLSTRANVGTGNDVMIGGIYVQGYGAATLVFRGIGPSLDPYFTDPVLANPALELRDSSGALIYWNDNWQDSQGAEISATGLAPSNYYESAIKVTVGAGSYTAILSGVGGGTGVALVEVYDITPQPNAIRLANISTRAHSENGDLKETLGMIIQGSGNKNVIVRGLGPSIPLPGTLPNPFLQLYNSSGTLLQLNDNWRDSQQAEIAASGVAPTNNYESALIRSLEPGAYTAKLQDNSGTTGIAIVDTYDLSAAPTPIPTPTPPQRLLWQDSRTYAVLVGWNSTHTTHNPAPMWTSNQLSPLGPGTITVHFRGYANGTCQYYCGTPPPYNAWIYAQLLNQFGTVVAESTGGSVFQNSQNNTITRSFSWGGGPFYIRMMAQSDATFPNPDNVFLTYYDVYAP